MSARRRRRFATPAGRARWRRGAGTGTLGSRIFAGAGIAIGIPAAALELKRTHGHHLFQLAFTFGAIRQWRIGHPLLHLEHLPATVTLILIDRHFFSPSLTYILPDTGPEPLDSLSVRSLSSCFSVLARRQNQCNATDLICQLLDCQSHKTPIKHPWQVRILRLR